MFLPLMPSFPDFKYMGHQSCIQSQASASCQLGIEMRFKPSKKQPTVCIARGTAHGTIEGSSSLELKIYQNYTITQKKKKRKE